MHKRQYQNVEIAGVIVNTDDLVEEVKWKEPMNGRLELWFDAIVGMV